MDFFTEGMECDITFQRLNHEYESSYDMMMINVVQNMSDNIFESTLSDIYKATVDVIQKIIDTIVKYIKDTKDKIVSTVREKQLEKALKIVKENSSKINSYERVDMYDSEKAKEELDIYIREMLKLERRLMNVKVDSKVSSQKEQVKYIVECNIIMREMDELNNKFDKTMLDDNDYIIKMASKDAIRFAEKELGSLKVDYDEVEKGSEEILKQFKKDANGCEVPVKLNILQKMSNSLATRVRTKLYKMNNYKHSNLKVVLGFAVLLGGIGVKVYQNFPQVKQKVDTKVASVVNSINNLNKKMEEENAIKLAQLNARRKQ